VVREAPAWLEDHGSARVREEMATRYGIVTPRAFGVPVGTVQQLARRLGRDHELAAALWASGWYEARLLSAFVDEPAKVTSSQMERWARDFDNWAICDTLCFALWVRSPHAMDKVLKWATSREEFVKRGAFALLASVALKRKDLEDAELLKTLPLIEKAAIDERNFVKKGVNWALRGIGRRPGLRKAAVALAKRLAAREEPAPRWIGKDALRDLK
jgi:3-methyladenine DNA glycosylase AlkD